MIRGTSTKLQQGSRRQSPNRMTSQFQEMKTACPDQISAYARCVLNEESEGNITKDACSKEYAMVKNCFRQVRLQKLAASPEMALLLVLGIVVLQALPSTAFLAVPSFPPAATATRPNKLSPVVIPPLLFGAMYPWEGPLRDAQMQKFQQEETLLQMRLKVQPSSSNNNNVLPMIQKYVQSFAYAAVLPVQPLQYLPTEDGGVEIKFLRKKTKEKGSLDGGIRFWVLEDPVRKEDGSVDHSTTTNNNKTSTAATTKTVSQPGIEIIVKRNSEGQTCGKIFSEKLVVLAFVQSFTGQTTTTTTDVEYSNRDPPTNELVSVESIYHKWMDL